MSYPMAAARAAIETVRADARNQRIFDAMRMIREFKVDRDKLAALVGLCVPQEPELYQLGPNELELANVRKELESGKWLARGDPFRGFLGESVAAYALEYQGFVFEYGKFAESTGQRDFKLPTDKGQEITLEIKTSPEYRKSTDKSKGYSFALVADGIMDSNYCIAVKLCERPRHGSLAAIWGYMTHDQVKKIPIQSTYPCTKYPGKPIDLELPMCAIADLWAALRNEHHVKPVNITDIGKASDI